VSRSITERFGTHCASTLGCLVQKLAVQVRGREVEHQLGGNGVVPSVAAVNSGVRRDGGELVDAGDDAALLADLAECGVDDVLATSTWPVQTHSPRQFLTRSTSSRSFATIPETASMWVGKLLVTATSLSR
jgi:hypothetical protein